jgi:thiol-disulfide isomerase/thioredoxin
MTSKSRDSRRDAARARERAARRRRWLLPAIGIAVLAVAVIGAIALSGSGSGGASVRPSDGPAGSASTAPGTEPVISGTSLPAFADPAGDPAVGMTIPTVTSPTGSIAIDGRPKVLLFVAHWCPHCQNEVPLVQSWLDGGGLPADVDLITVSTAIDPGRPNYPPEAWLTGAGWTPPVITDPANTVADAYGLSAFPYWVFVNADGTVAGRLTGELPIADLETIIGGLAR